MFVERLRRSRLRLGASAKTRAQLFGVAGAVLTLFGCDHTVLAVTSATDGEPGSLRAILARVNSEPALTEAIIQLPGGTYDLTLCGDDDTNQAGDLDITSSALVTLVGTGPGVVIRQTCAGERVLDARGVGRLMLRNLTITGGALGGSDHAQGGGVRAAADVVLDRATLTANSADGGYGEAYGGGIYVAGSLSSIDSHLSSNSLTAFSSGTLAGGGAYVMGAVNVSGGRIADNGIRESVASEVRGGGIAQASPDTTVKLRNVELAGNYATCAFIHPLGPPPPQTLNCAAVGGAIAAAGVLQVERVTAVNNIAKGGSGGIVGSARGGALAGESTLDIRASTFQDNTAQGGFGGWYGMSCWSNFTCFQFGAYPREGAVGRGGAAWAAGAADAHSSTFRGNRAIAGADSAAGLLLGGAIASEGAATLANSTLSGNVAEGNRASCTLVLNTWSCGASRGPSGAAAVVAGTLTLRYTTISGNSGQNVLAAAVLVSHGSAVAAEIPVCAPGARVDSSSYNWFSDSSCALAGTGDRQESTDLLLGALGDNGGPVQTQVPGAGSVLIDYVPTAACTLAEDARGIARPAGSACDVGAVEVAVTSP